MESSHKERASVMAEKEQENHLPDNIIFQEILTRMSAKTLIKFKSVSKHWYKTITSSWFSKLHARNSSPGILTVHEYGQIPPVYYHPSTKESYEINLDNIFKKSYYVKDSCDGMLVLEGESGVESKHYLCMMNPVTGNFIMIPSPAMSVAEKCKLVFDHTLKQYNLVVWHTRYSWYRISKHPEGEPEDSCSDEDDDVDDYDDWGQFNYDKCSAMTLCDGSSAWQKLILPKGKGHKYPICEPTMVNHKIYWLAEIGLFYVTLCMDIATEKIEEIESPFSSKAFVTWHWKSYLMEIDGFLYCVYYTCHDYNCYIIWVCVDLEKYKWIKLYQKYKVHDFCVCCDPDYALVCEELECGDIEQKVKKACRVEEDDQFKEVMHCSSLCSLVDKQPVCGLQARNLSFEGSDEFLLE